jgi:hypothetical protein
MTTARGVTPAGSIIDIPDNLLPRLRGKVEPLPILTDLEKLIGETLAEIDRAGRPWSSWRKSLTPEQRQSVREAEQGIDSTFAALDRQGLMSALDNYSHLLLTTREAMQ